MMHRRPENGDSADFATLLRALGIGRLFYSIQDSVVVADIETESIVAWNPAAHRMFGYTAEEALRLPLEALVPERLKELHRAGLARYRVSGEGNIIGTNRPVEVPAVRKDGSEFFIELVLSAISDDSTNGCYVLATIRDITERRRLEALKDDFITSAAHELRTPVTAVLGFAELLKRRGKLSEEMVEECVSTLNREAQRLSTLIQNMLDLGRLERGRMELQLTPVDLAETATRSLEVNPPPRDKSVDVAVARDLKVLADPERLDQIVTNLLSNAYRYGGPAIRIGASSKRDTVHLSVSDNGEGVPADLVPRLFEPFARGQFSSGFGGSGLGLAIVQKLAETMGGDVAYVGDGHSGATFTVRLEKTG